MLMFIYEWMFHFSKLKTMNVNIIENSQFQTSSWSGGTTTELYISPKDSSYSKRNFDVRISTAKVDIEESTFTALPGIYRKLMVLEGEITLSHENRHSKELKPLDVDTFEGGWTTKSIGTCVDFNVMTNKKTQSDLCGLKIEAGSKTQIEVEKKWDCLCLYAIAGKLQIQIDQKSFILEQGNLIVIDDLSQFVFPIQSLNECQIAVVKIK